MNSSWLLFADTPLQMYNSALLASSLKQSASRIDLIVYKQFNNAYTFVELYTKLKIFDKIIVCETYNPKQTRDLFIWELSVCFGKQKLNYSNLCTENYDHLALACPTAATFELLVYLKKRNPSLRVVFYEDGTGSYNGNVFQQIFYFDKPPFKKKKTEWFIRAIRNIFSLPYFEKFRYCPESIYLKRPDLIGFTSPIEAKPLNAPSDYIDKFLSITPSSPSTMLDSNDANIIILDTARLDEATPESEIIDLTAALMINSSSANFLYRTHPRSKSTPSWALKNCKDFSGGFWELICRTNDSFDNALLVSSCSTAQLAPLIEANKKPYLLMLYRIAFATNEYGYMLGEQIAKMAKKGYGKDSDRILIPRTKEELMIVINKIDSRY